jgi:hypothetical protein
MADGFKTMKLVILTNGTIVAHLLAHTSVNTTSKYYIYKKTNIIKSQLNNIKTLNDK